MKNHKKIKYAALLGCMALGTTLTSCNEWLTLYPMDKIVEENFWEDKKDLESVRNAAYVNMISSACMERYMVWGELRGDNFDKNPGGDLQSELQDILSVDLKPSNSYFDWSSFYSTINYCNKVLQHGPEILKKDNSFSESDWEQMRAEMVTLRALNYFYLIRTFDEVPMVFQAINDDSEVKALKATPQDVLLDSLVSQMEYIVKINKLPPSASTTDGFITDQAVHTILADLYLWRGSYYETRDKAKADSNYQACINHCDRVIALKDAEYQKNNTSGSFPSMGGGSTSDSDNPYHLIQNKGIEGVGLTQSNAYNEIFGTKNSFESIFELQFDGTVNSNSLISTYYRNNDGATRFYPTVIAVALSSTPDDASNNALYSKTDLRRWATIQKIDEDVHAIVKYAASSIDQPSLKDNTNTAGRNEPSYFLRGTQNANWIFYRYTDVLLMKAEAMCMIGTNLKGAFELVQAVNERSNPYATQESDKLPASLASNKTDLEGLILRERNREFFGEGKRWFDLVRYAMRKGDTEGPSKAFAIFGKKFVGSNASLAKNKYMQGMKVMYSPYAESEIKANPLLVQNPLWNDQSTIQKK